MSYLYNNSTPTEKQYIDSIISDYYRKKMNTNKSEKHNITSELLSETEPYDNNGIGFANIKKKY